jgi:hypothetical protein
MRTDVLEGVDKPEPLAREGVSTPSMGVTGGAMPRAAMKR